MILIKKERQQSIDIYLWVNENLPKIKKHAMKYRAFSPYELEEFVQSAYEAALLAEKNEGYEFERSFWFHFKKSCLNMTYSHGDKKIKCYHDEFREFGDDDNPPTYACMTIQPTFSTDKDDTMAISEDAKDAIFREALSLMTSKEREVWELLLRGLGIKQAATYLGKSKTAIIKLKEAGKKRAVKKLLFFPQEKLQGYPFPY